MVLLVGWVVVLLLLALWSGLVWSGEALLVALLAKAGSVGAVDWSLPQSLTDWLPTWAAEWLAGTVENLTPQLQALAGALPSLSGWVSALAWLVWGGGALLLLALGLFIHVMVALWRKSSRSSVTTSTA
jgi:hypothetical protein